MNQLANFVTGLSLACGFASIIFSLEAQFTFASWAIIFSVIFDGLDGQVARKNPLPSQFGKELDSLVDVVCFGVAPSVLGYIFIYQEFSFWATLALFTYLVCSILRLAKYNITPKEKMVNYFIGLPTTASGGVLASFILIYRKKQEMALPPFIPRILSPNFVPLLFVCLVLVLAFLMVSRARYLNLDGIKQLLGRKLRVKVAFLLLILLLMAAAIFKKAGIAVFTLFFIYLLFSPFVVKRLNHR